MSEKPALKVNYFGKCKDIAGKASIIREVMEKHYRVELAEDPDFLLCSIFGKPYGHNAYEGVRLMFSNENFMPDFNLFDYATSYDYMDYGERYLRFPLWLFCTDARAMDRQHLNKLSKEDLKDKPYFCNFIYNHPGDGERRVKMMELLRQHRRVECAGRYKNNMPGDWYAQSYEEKMAFQAKCKFSVAFDSVALPGFVTEKIKHAFLARSIPIYFGDPTITQTFNPKCFVNVGDFASLEEAAQRVIEIDQNVELYLDMINQPLFLEEGYVEKRYAEMEKFLLNIFSQGRPAAYRRPLSHFAKVHNDRLLACTAKLARREKDSFVRRSLRFAGQEYRAGGAKQVLRKIGVKIKYNAGLIWNRRWNKLRSQNMSE